MSKSVKYWKKELKKCRNLISGQHYFYIHFVKIIGKDGVLQNTSSISLEQFNQSISNDKRRVFKSNRRRY